MNCRKLLNLILISGIVLLSFTAVSQPVFTIENKKDACDGMANGSLEILVTSASGDVVAFIFSSGAPIGPLTPIVGEPLLVSGLVGTAAGREYTVIVADDGGNFDLDVTIFSLTPNLSAVLQNGFPINNANCSNPNGQIRIDVTGGSGNYSYAWTSSNGFTSNNEDITGLAGGSYTVLVSDNGTNCTRTLGPIVITDPSPTVQNVTTASPSVLCAGDDATISLANSQGGGVTYQVLINGNPFGTPSTSGGGPLTLTVPSGSYANGDVLTVEAVDGVCTPMIMNGSVTIQLNPLPAAPTINFTPSSYCIGQTITAPSVSSPVGSSTYRWYSDAGLTTLLTTGTTPTNAQLGFSSAAAGTTTVYVTQTSAASCTGPATPVTLTINAIPLAPAVTFTPSTYCVGQTITAPVITGPIAGSTYTWYSDAGLTTVLTTGATPTNAQLGYSSTTANTRTVYVRETTASNCSGPATSITLTVNANPVAPTVAFSPSSYCVGQAITAPVISAPVGGSTYTWYSDAGLTTVLTTGTAPTNGQLNFSSASANVTTVYVTETNSNSCRGPATTVTLTVNANPVAPAVTFTPNTYCTGQAITAPVITTPNGGSTYTWYSDAGLTTVLTTGTAPSNAQLGFSSASVNTKTVYVRETSGSNCAGPATAVTLTVNATPVAPVVTFTPSTYCVGQTITPPTVNAPVGGSTYTWYSDAGLTNVLTTGATPTNAQLGFSSASAGTTTVFVRETTASNCSGPATSITLTINANPIAPTVAFSPSTYCVGQTITAPTITGAVGGSTYTWYSDAGLTTVLTTGTSPTNAQLGFSSASVNTTTVYVRETNSNTCAGPATAITLTVNAVPVAPVVTFTPSTYCVGETITAPVVSSPNGGSTYTWYSDAGLTTVLTTGTTPTIAQLGFSSASANTTTVYVRETTSSNCSGPATTVTLTVNAIPAPPAVTFTSTYCIGQAITAPVITTPVGGTTYTWYSDAGLTNVLTTGTAPTNAQLGFSSATANTTTVYVTATSASNCTSPATTVTLTVNADPVAPTVTFTPSTYCVGDAITAPVVSAPNGGSTYTWYSDAGLTTILTTGTTPTNAQLGFSSAAPNTTTVYVKETSGSTCAGPATTVTLTVNTNPVAPAITFTPTTYCIGQAITAPTISTPNGSSTYTWYSDAGLTTVLTTGMAPTNAQLGFSSASANTTSVYVTETNASNCESPATTVTLTVSASPNAPVVTFTSAYCVGQSITAPTISSPNGGSTYTWYSDAGLTNVLTTGTAPTNVQLGFSSASANTTTVYVTETSAGNCTSATTTVTLVVSPTPDPTINAAGPFCTSDLPVQLTAATNGGTWSGPGITDATLGTFDPSVAGAGSKTITYQITVGGCTAVDSRSVIVFASPNATITPAGPFCATDAAENLSATTGGGTWSGTGITDPVLGTFDPATAGIGVHTITYSVTVGSCADTKTIDITVGAQPDATITAVGPMCTSDAAITLTAVTAGGTWTGSGITDISTGTFDPLVAGAGTHTITYEVEIGGCSDSNSIDIVVELAPDATITSAGPFCITDGSTNLVAASPGGTWSGTGITDANLGTFSPALAGQGTWVITYTVTNGTCQDTDDISITVANQPDATITATGPLCTADGELTLTAVTGGGTWSGTGITDASAGTFDPAVAGPGTHTITYEITIGGCSDSKSIDIVVNQSPDATLTPAGPFCITDAAVNLTAATPGGVWSGTGITNAATGTFDPATAGVGSFVITYTISGTCNDSDQITVTVANPPDATINAAGPLCTGDGIITLSAATPGGTWSGAGVVDASTGEFDPAVAGPGTHTITYSITIGGCADTDTQDIIVNPSPDATITAAGPFCISDAAVTLVAATAGGTWTGTGITNPATGAFDPATAGVGSHIIQYQIAGVCSDNDAITIVVANPPDATITPVPAQCTGGGVITLAGATPGGTWSGTGITNASNGTFDPATAGVGTHTITYAITIGGCSDTETTDIVVNQSADATFAQVGPFCPSNAAVNLVPVTGGGVWSGNGITDVNAGTFDPSVAGTGTHVITYTLSANGCQSVFTRSIVVRSAADAACNIVAGSCGALVDIPITAISTTCADPDNGALIFNLAASYDVTVVNQLFKDNPAHPDAVNITERGSTVTISPLKANKYFYTIKDIAGNVCVQDFSYTLEQETIVQATSKVVNENVTCFGSATGSITLGATGTTTGKYFYEYQHNGNTVNGEFIIGSPILNIPATDDEYLVIKVDESLAFACPDTVMIRVQHLFPQIQFANITTTAVTTCSGSDGTISVPGTTGGSGTKQIRLYEFTPSGPVVVEDFADVTADPFVFSNRTNGTYYIEIRDASGCSVTTESDPVTISSPGGVTFTVDLQANAECGPNAGKNGVVVVRFDATEKSGTYQIGVSTSPVIEPEKYFTYTYNQGIVEDIPIDTLSRGNFFVFVKPNGPDVCPSVRPTGFIDGPYMIDFDVQRVCGLTDGSSSVNLVNVQGDPSVSTYNIEVYKVSNPAEKVEEFTADEINDIISISYVPNGTGEHAWLNDPDQFVIKAYQLNQLYCLGERPPRTPSHEEVYTVSIQLGLVVEDIKASFPEPRRSGGFELKTVTGGLPFNDGDGPYYSVSVFDPSTNSEIIGPLKVKRNAQGNYHYDFRNLPIGNYEVQVTDAYGCTVSYVAIVPADTRLLIPNIFTPNGDNVNDLFEIINLPTTGKNELTISNRWGKEVFASRNYQEGKFWSAEDAPEGLYFYRLQIDGGKETYSGWVEVVRGSKP